MGTLITDNHWEYRTSDPEFAELSGDLKEWLVGKPYDIETRRWLDGGSGSYVLVARKTPVDMRGRFEDLVLKLIPPEIGEKETQRVRAASRSQPESFRRAHLVELVIEDRLPGLRWWIHLQKVARGNLDQMPTLADVLDRPRLHGYCATIVQSLMKEWNEEAVAPPAEHPKDFFEGFLGERLDQDHVWKFADQEGISLDGSQPVSFPGRDTQLPNPFALVTGRNEEWQIREQVFRGNSHGDLHTRNVLVPMTGANHPVTASQYQLIDLGRFDINGPLSHDPMKLLLAVAAEWLPSLVPHSAIRSSLAELVVCPARHPASAPVAGYLNVAKGIHNAAEQWAVGRGSGGAEWRRQNVLVLIGCALRYFAHERISEADRWWYLEVAALATREFVQRSDPQGSRSITSPTESCATGRTPLLMDLPPRGQQVQDVTDNVVYLPGLHADPDPAPLLTDLADRIHRLPSGTSGARLAVLAIKLEEKQRSWEMRWRAPNKSP